MRIKYNPYKTSSFLLSILYYEYEKYTTNHRLRAISISSLQS